MDDKEIRIPSTAAIFSHPVHPMTVTFPIAFLIGAFAADLAFWWFGEPFWAHMAFWLIAGGLAGGLVSAASGITDFLSISKVRNKVRSWSHFLAAIMVISLATANLMQRWGNTVDGVLPFGLLLSTNTVIMLAFTGFLGGKLVFHHLIGTYLEEEEEPG